METVVRLLRGGQVTIPEEIREAMGLSQGDLLRITIEKIGKGME